MADEKGYRLKLSGQGMNLDRIVAAEIAQRIVSLVIGGFSPGGGGSAPSGRTAPGPMSTGPTDRPAVSIREFLVQHEAKRIPEQIATIAMYFKSHHNSLSFTKKELVKAFEDAQEPVPKNLPRDISWAVRNGWIAPKTGQKNSYYITGTGESAVTSKFPDEIRKKTKQPGGSRRRRKKEG